MRQLAACDQSQAFAAPPFSRPYTLAGRSLDAWGRRRPARRRPM